MRFSLTNTNYTMIIDGLIGELTPCVTCMYHPTLVLKLYYFHEYLAFQLYPNLSRSLFYKRAKYLHGKREQARSTTFPVTSIPLALKNPSTRG